MQAFPDGLIALALHQSSIKNSQLRTLLQAVDRLEDVLMLSSDKLLLSGLTAQHRVELEGIYQQLEQVFTDNSVLAQQWQYCLERQIGIITLKHDAYPALLKQIFDPPPILYYQGDISLLNSPQLAMVGSRRSTQQGGSNAQLFAKAFAKGGFTITSGMALGIDTESHTGALAAQGKTIAVLGTGVDVIYPWRNRDLYQKIIDQGLVISELPLGSEPKKGHFPRRNRIISGMSLGVLVIEATLRSGSLITAKLALEQGREVFAMPGSIHNPASRGCHALIRDGAKLVETVDHVMEELVGWLPQEVVNKPEQQSLNLAPNIQPELQSLLDKLGYDPQPIDVIQQRINMPVTELMANLVQLELKGLVENVAGSYQRIS